MCGRGLRGREHPGHGGGRGGGGPARGGGTPRRAERALAVDGAPSPTPARPAPVVNHPGPAHLAGSFVRGARPLVEGRLGAVDLAQGFAQRLQPLIHLVQLRGARLALERALHHHERADTERVDGGRAARAVVQLHLARAPPLRLQSALHRVELVQHRVDQRRVVEPVVAAHAAGGEEGRLVGERRRLVRALLLGHVGAQLHHQPVRVQPAEVLPHLLRAQP
eukprot:scaffold3721_cov134-Isochrysis_galbana.AAC.18